MKILIRPARHHEEGVAVIVVLALLAIMLIFVNANIRALYSLGRELKLIEQQQIKRLNARTNPTNAVAAQFSSPGVNSTPAVTQAPSQPTSQ
jgi:hypothetical protein